jgi:hypothetical protein
MTKWIEFVRDWSKKNGLTYSQALKDPRLKAEYAKPKAVGGTTAEIRDSAGLLRTRLFRDPKDGLPKDNSGLIVALNQLTHSADAKGTLDKMARGYPQNPYVDYKNIENFVLDAVPAPLGRPLDVITNGFRQYFGYLKSLSKDAILKEMDELPDAGWWIPKDLEQEWEDTKDAMAEILDPPPPPVKRIFTKEDVDEMRKDAFWVNAKNPEVRNISKLRESAKKAYSKKDFPEFQRIVGMIEDAYEKNFAEAVRAYNKKFDVLDGFHPQNKIGIRFPIKLGEDEEAIEIGGRGAGSSRSRVAPEPLAYYEQEGLARLRAERRAREIAEMEAREAQRIANARAEAKAEAEAKKAKKREALIRKAEAEAKKREDIESIKAEKMRKQKAIKMAEKDVKYDVSSGSSESDDTEGEGIRKGKIDFEDIKWGSFTEQLNAYNSGKSKKLSLENFAKMILKDPSKYKAKTLKRARFYLNVLIKKKK